MSVFRLIGVVVLLVGSWRAARAEDWPQFRGPSGQGSVTERGLPTTWSADKPDSVRWKTPLPEKISNPFSSPIVSRGKVFVTITQDDPPRRQWVMGFDLKDGKPLWKTEVPLGPWAGGRNNGYPTPAADGEHVFALFGSAVLAALDYDGHLVWSQPLKKYDFDVAIGSSPVLFQDHVLLLCDQNNHNSSLIAFDKSDGKIAWESPRPEMVFAHSTPLLANIAGSTQLVVSVSKAIQGLDPTSGKILWWCDSDGDTSSPAYADGLLYADGGRGGQGICLDPSGTGDLTKTNVKWKVPAMNGLGSPIIVDHRMYRLLDPGVLKCFNMADGSPVYHERLEGASTWASPIATPEGNIYFATSGKSYVVKSGPKFERVAVNDLGDANNASPAVADGMILLKGQKFLWCIGPAK